MIVTESNQNNPKPKGKRGGWNKGLHISFSNTFYKGCPGYWLGKTFSEQHREKLRLAGKRRGAFFKGRRHTDEAKEKIRKACKGKIPANKGLSIGGRPPLPFDLDKAVQLYSDGLTAKQVAGVLGCSANTVQRRLNKIGALRSKSESSRKSWTPERRNVHSAKVSASYKSGLRKIPDITGDKNPFYGKRHDPETIERVKAKLSVMFAGIGNPQWQGGKSMECYGVEFTPYLRKQIRQRDDNKCVKCSKPEDLVVHHKDSDKQNNDPSNLVTLCRTCHAQEHRFWPKKKECVSRVQA